MNRHPPPPINVLATALPVSNSFNNCTILIMMNLVLSGFIENWFLPQHVATQRRSRSEYIYL